MAWIRGYRAPGLRRRDGTAMVVGEEGAEERKEEWRAVSGEEEVAMAVSPVGCCSFLIGLGDGPRCLVWVRRTAYPSGEERAFLGHMFSLGG